MAFHVSVPSPLSTPGSNRRRHGRIVCDSVRCTIGEVLEFSASGARIRTPYDRIRTGDETTIEVLGHDGPISITVKVIWIAAEEGDEKDKHVLAGLKYVNPSDEAKRALNELARAASSNPTIGR